MIGWSKVYTSKNPISAEFVKNELESNEIKAVVLNKQDSSYLLGNLEVYVPTEFAEIAKVVVETYTNNESEEKTE